jgi:hypothetical protein
MRKPEIISYKGKNIIYIDLSGMKNQDEIMQLEKEASELIRQQPPKSALTLTNMDGMYFNNTLKSYFESLVKLNAPHVKSGAVIGMNGLISIMYNAFVSMTGRNIKSHKSKEEAMEYLVSQN